MNISLLITTLLTTTLLISGSVHLATFTTIPSFIVFCLSSLIFLFYPTSKVVYGGK